jgi:transcriptional regulator with XRE-family HTH domain
MATEYARALGSRLRSIRQQQNLSLQGVEEKSGGRWKAVVIGSYERGDRAITVAKLSELAEFYGVPVGELLPDGGAGSAAEPPTRVVIDLVRLATIPQEVSQPLLRYAAAVQAQRGDYNGRVLSIRRDDLRTLAVMYDRSPGDLAEELIRWGVLNPEARGAVE